MSDFRVEQYGTDSSGRPILMTRYMHRVWLMILAHPDVAPFAHLLVIVQGAFMSRVAGGGADSSAGYHDKGGCADIRTWNLSPAQLAIFIRVARSYGWAFWRRDAAHGGMDPHAHGVLGTDSPLASGAALQWQQYLAGQDGLSPAGPDYEPRPSPLATRPPEQDWYDMASEADLRAIVRDELGKALPELSKALAEAVGGNLLDVGRKFKWSDDTVAKSIIDKLARIEAKIGSDA